jgi:hypothetical protein
MICSHTVSSKSHIQETRSYIEEICIFVAYPSSLYFIVLIKFENMFFCRVTALFSHFFLLKNDLQTLEPRG